MTEPNSNPVGANSRERKPVKRWRRWGVRAMFAFLLFVMVPWLLAAGCAAAPGPVAPFPEVEQQEWNVYALDWGHHTSLVLENPPGWRLGPAGKPDARFVEFGWGDRRYYKDENHSIDALLVSAFLPSDSVVSVRGWDSPPKHSGLYARYDANLPTNILRTLATVIEQSMLRTDAGERQPPMTGGDWFPGSFYESRLFYVIWSNCNTWTVETLEDSGFDVCSLFVFTANQTMCSVAGLGWDIASLQ